MAKATGKNGHDSVSQQNDAWTGPSPSRNCRCRGCCDVTSCPMDMTQEDLLCDRCREFGIECWHCHGVYNV